MDSAEPTDRQTRAILILAALLLALVAFGAAWLLYPFPRHRPIEDLTSVRDDQPEEFYRRVRRVVRNAWTVDLRKLENASSVDVALAAGWERVVRSAPTTWTYDSVRPDPKVIEEFLGLTERTTGTSIPWNWRELIRGTAVYQRGNQYHAQFQSLTVFFPKYATIAKVGEERFLEEDGQKRTLPAGYGRRADRALGLQTTNGYVVALFNSIGGSFELLAIDGVNGTVRWSATVWACLTPIALDGWSPGPIVEMALRNEQVIIFGVEFRSAFVEKFDLKTGHNVLRFSTDFVSSAESVGGTDCYSAVWPRAATGG